MFEGFFSLACMVMVMGSPAAGLLVQPVSGEELREDEVRSEFKSTGTDTAYPDKQLLLVRLQNHVYLLGVSQNGIQLLTELEGDYTGQETEEAENRSPGFAGFKEIYDSLCQKKKEETDE